MTVKTVEEKIFEQAREVWGPDVRMWQTWLADIYNEKNAPSVPETPEEPIDGE